MLLLRNDIVWAIAQPCPAEKITLSLGSCWTLDSAVLIPSHIGHCHSEKIFSVLQAHTGPPLFDLSHRVDVQHIHSMPQRRKVLHGSEIAWRRRSHPNQGPQRHLSTPTA
jgi:hypothetical protein